MFYWILRYLFYDILFRPQATIDKFILSTKYIYVIALKGRKGKYWI